MTSGSHNGDGGRHDGDHAADSTQFHPKEVLGGENRASESFRRRHHSDTVYAGKSIRRTAKAAPGSLAMKIALPILVALLIGLFACALVLRRKVFDIQLADLKSDVAYSAYNAGAIGRVLLSQREEFRAKHPDYKEKSEWLTGDYWPLTMGIVDENAWLEATGFDLNEYAPIATLEAAREKTVLSDLGAWINSTGAGGELAAVFILDEEGDLFASAANASFRFDYLALKSAPPPIDFREIAGNRIMVDHIDSIGPEPVVRGIARIQSRKEPGRRIGSAIAVMRTARAETASLSILYAALALSGALAAVTAMVAWYAARRVTGPMRRLAADMRAMAEGDFARRSGLAESDEIGMLAEAFNSMAERLRVARVNERENSRLESDLAIARSIQNNLLPLQTPRVRGLDIHTSYRPAKEIGGDYFDFLPVDSQHMGLAVADASGKSIPAALVMSTTRAILRFVAPGNNSAAETLSRVNAILSVDIPKGMFVTAYYVILDPLNSQMLCASAGHTPLLIARADGTVELMNPGGIALGFDNGPIFQRSIREQRVKLERGDRVLLYTDGVVECVNPANEEYSDRRLREFLRRNRELSSHDFIGALVADLDRHRGTADMRDDTTIVTFKVL